MLKKIKINNRDEEAVYMLWFKCRKPVPVLEGENSKQLICVLEK